MANHHLERAYRLITDALPATLAARADLMRPGLLRAWGGPLNGQVRRREIVREIAALMPVTRVIETGTHCGTSTGFFADVFGTPVDSIEGSPRFAAYSKMRLAGYADITVTLGDSREVLKRLALRPGASSELVFFYLDAHWAADLPLRAEIEIIADRWPRAVVMIDDFEVEGDAGYGFDDYGAGKRLTASYLPPVEGWSEVFYPVARSADETGVKRGCCVIASLDVSETLGRLKTLRRAEPSPVRAG